MSNPTSKPFRVAILLHQGYTSSQRVLKGILRYQQSHGHWQLDILAQNPTDVISHELTPENYDGVIGNFFTMSVRHLIKKLAVPTVFWHARANLITVPRRVPWYDFVQIDNFAIAECALDYFLSRGYESFAYVGMKTRFVWSYERRNCFSNRLAQLGHICRIAPVSRAGDDARTDESRLVNWLRKLPKGTAVFAANDERARTVLDRCAALGIKVPDELAVLGVDNDELLCETANPPISSIKIDWEAAGYRVAESLDSVMRLTLEQKPLPPPRVITFGASGVVTRASTNTLLSNDQVVRRVLELLSGDEGVRLKVKDLMNITGLTRRSLELHFAHTLGISPYEAILRARFERVKTLARDPSITNADIAYRCGFSSPSHLFNFFKQRAGQTLMRYRCQDVGSKS